MNRRGFLVLFLGLILLTLCSSCKFGNRINEANDKCPILLIEGVTLTGVESTNNGAALKFSISYDKKLYDFPAYTHDGIRNGINSTVEKELELHYDMLSLICLDVSCSELIKVARDEKKGIYVYYDGYY